MTSAIIQTTLAALVGLFLWRWLVRSRVVLEVGTLFAAGLFVRSMAGVGAFWVSYLRLPLLSDLHGSPGFWFFGLDSEHYYGQAMALSASGLGSLADSYGDLQGAPFVVALAVLMRMFGAVPSIGLLLNLILYVATCWSIVSWSSEGRGMRRSGRIALAFYCFSPSLVIWSTQPLKDTAVYCAIAIFLCGWSGLVAALATAGSWTRVEVARNAALLLTGTVLLAGLRPYLVPIAWSASLISLLPVVRTAGARRPLSLAGALLAAAMVLVVAIGARGSRLPGAFLVNPGDWTAVREVLPRLKLEVESARRSLEVHGGATDIRSGYLLHWMDRDEQVSPRERSVLLHQDMPISVEARLIAGMTALVVPRFVAMPAVIRMEGGRGFWLVAEFDTVWFDVLLLVVLVSMFRQGKQVWSLPAVWQTGAMVVLTIPPIIYIVSNFGSLLRQRGMVLVLLVMLLASLPDTAMPDDDRGDPSRGSRPPKGVAE